MTPARLRRTSYGILCRDMIHREVHHIDNEGFYDYRGSPSDVLLGTRS